MVCFFHLNFMWNSFYVRPSHLYIWCVQALCYRYVNVKSKINEGLQEQVISLSVCPSDHPSVRQYVCMFDSLSVSLSVCLVLYQSVHLSVGLSACLFYPLNLILCLYTFTIDVCKLFIYLMQWTLREFKVLCIDHEMVIFITILFHKLSQVLQVLTIATIPDPWPAGLCYDLHTVWVGQGELWWPCCRATRIPASHTGVHCKQCLEPIYLVKCNLVWNYHFI